MKTVKEILAENQDLRGALRVLTGKTNSGKRAIYISGNPPGFRLLAKILQAQADSVGGDGGRSKSFVKLERESGSLFSRRTIRWRSSKSIAKTIFPTNTKRRRAHSGGPWAFTAVLPGAAGYPA